MPQALIDDDLWARIEPLLPRRRRRNRQYAGRAPIPDRAVLTGILFVLPGALVMLALSVLYALGRGIPAVEGALFGIKAAVLVIVVEALIRIGKRGLKTWPLITLAGAAFVCIFFLNASILGSFATPSS